MARLSIADEITRLETELTNLQTVIQNQQAVTSMEEGGGGSRFLTDFTPADKLYAREREINVRLQTLYSYTERRA